MSLRSLALMGTYALVATALTAIAQGTGTGKPLVPPSFKDAQLEWRPCPAFMPKGCEITVLRDPAAERMDVFLKVPANSQFPSHGRTSVERVMLAQGELHVRYEEQESGLGLQASWSD